MCFSFCVRNCDFHTVLYQLESTGSLCHSKWHELPQTVTCVTTVWHCVHAADSKQHKEDSDATFSVLLFAASHLCDSFAPMIISVSNLSPYVSNYKKQIWGSHLFTSFVAFVKMLLHWTYLRLGHDWCGMFEVFADTSIREQASCWWLIKRKHLWLRWVMEGG